MPRTPNQAHRAALLAAVTDHLLAHGLNAVSLRELADAAGTSSRMLVHHFGSKDRLLQAAVGEARRRQRSAFDERLRSRPNRPYPAVLDDAWRWFLGPEAQPYLRLFGELHALARQPRSPFADFAQRSVLDWLPTLEDGFVADGATPADARRYATLTLAVIRGLFMDLHALDDAARVNAASGLFTELLAHRPPSSARR